VRTMKMLVAVIGTVINSTVKKKGHCYSFNLKPVDEPDDIYHVISMGAGQRQMIADLLENYEKIDLVLMGYGFTYRSSKCNQHHFTVKPIFIVPLHDYDAIDSLHDVIAQWFLASLLANGKHKPTVIPFRAREAA
jgi:hypothetical protein